MTVLSIEALARAGLHRRHLARLAPLRRGGCGSRGRLLPVIAGHDSRNPHAKRRETSEVGTMKPGASKSFSASTVTPTASLDR